METVPVRQTVSKREKGLSVPDAAMLIKLAEVLDVPVSKLLGSEIETEEKPDALAEQLSSINEQLAKKNRCAKMAWKVIAFIAGGIFVAYILLIIFAKIFAFSPKQPSSREETQVIAEAVGIE